MVSLKKKDKDEGKDHAQIAATIAKRKKEGIETQTINLEELEKQKKDFGNFYAKSYRLLSEKVKFLFPRLINLEKSIRMAGMMVQYEAYVCGLVLASIIAGIIGLVSGLVIILIFNIDPPEFEMIFPIICGTVNVTSHHAAELSIRVGRRWGLESELFK